MNEWMDISDLIDKAQELFDCNLIDEAIDLLESYKVVFSSEWELYFLLSRGYSEKDQPDLAIENLKTGLRYDKDNPDLLLGLFYAFLQKNYIQKGVKYLYRANRLYPENEQIINALIYYYTEINDFIKAIELFERRRLLFESNPETLRNIGLAYERNGDFEKALSCFLKSLELNPTLDETRDSLADHYILRGEPEKSIQLYEQYLMKSPNNIRALSRLVYCHSQVEQFKEAEKVAKQIVRTYPNSPIGYVDLAYVYINLDKMEDALQIANKALDVSPIDAESHRVMGIAYSELNDIKKAEASFKKALSFAPDNPEIMRDYYNHLRTIGKEQKMENLVQKVIKQEYPYCTEDYWYLADYYREKGDNLKAFHYLSLAYRTMPGEKELIPPMVDILLDMGHSSFAIPILKHYIESKGWNDIMKEFTSHKKLQGKWSQEGLRFLQFYGQRPNEFRNFIFAVYVRKSFFLAINLLFIVGTGLGYLYYSYKGVIGGVLLYALVYCLIRIVVAIKKHTSMQKNLQ